MGVPPRVSGAGREEDEVAVKRQRAACANYDPEMWFPVGTKSAWDVEQTELAKAICSICPIRAKCLEGALEYGVEFGIWGGKTADERRAILRRGGYVKRSKDADHRDRSELVRVLGGVA
jgi:WhiB family redox-sensing transcriptional regulator